jgi:hypothetical protein
MWRPRRKLSRQAQHLRELVAAIQAILPTHAWRQLEIHREAAGRKNPQKGGDRRRFLARFVGVQRRVRSTGAPRHLPQRKPSTGPCAYEQRGGICTETVIDFHDPTLSDWITLGNPAGDTAGNRWPGWVSDSQPVDVRHRNSEVGSLLALAARARMAQ